MRKNAIILAAGKSASFAPFTYEKPKGLFCIKGKILIERQIEQLKEAGVADIYIVVGYMKEKFFYLEKKYGVHLIINNQFNKKGNLYSLYLVREYLKNTYICCVDHYFTYNVFLDDNKNNISYRAIAYEKGKFREFAIKYSDADVITEVQVGGENSYAMIGHAYINEKFSIVLKKLMQEEINNFGVSSMFWEEFYAKHIKELTLYKKDYSVEDILEFESIEDLRAFDAEFLFNVDSDIINNICNILKCNPNDITEIEIINAGLTNVSFSFKYKHSKFVYRHPGATADNLINRKSEKFAQITAKNLGIDKSVIHIDLSGWKISHFVEEVKNCDFEKNEWQLNIAMQYLRKLHQVKINGDVKIFDNIYEGKKLMKIACSTKGNLFKEFEDIIDKVDRLYKYIEADAKRLEYNKVLCHNDTYAPNFLCDKYGEIYLIDWEYAGINYSANDIGCILCRSDWNDSQIEKYLKAFVGRELTSDEHRYYIAFIPISAFYWFCWGLYKGSVGDDDSFFFLPSYRNLVRFIDVALESYEKI